MSGWRRGCWWKRAPLSPGWWFLSLLVLPPITHPSSPLWPARPLVCHPSSSSPHPPTTSSLPRSQGVFNRISLLWLSAERLASPSEARLKQRFPICDCVPRVSPCPDSIGQSRPPSLLRAPAFAGPGLFLRGPAAPTSRCLLATSSVAPHSPPPFDSLSPCLFRSRPGCSSPSAPSPRLS